MSKLIVANWKQNKNLKNTADWLIEFEKLVKNQNFENVNVVICPSAPYLNHIYEFTKKYDWLYTGAQDVSEYDQGSHTGYIGAEQLNDFVEYCIVGHSERSEPSSVVLKKAKKCIENSITPIVCFKEAAMLRNYQDLDAYFLWEDPATISKGGEFRPKPLDEIQEGILKITDSYNVGKGLLYGGSINKENAKGLSEMKKLDGGVSGSASLDPRHFFEIIKFFEQL